MADLASPGRGSFYSTSPASTITANTYFVNNNQISVMPSQIVLSGFGADTAPLYESVDNNAISAVGSSALLTTGNGMLTNYKFTTMTATQLNGTHGRRIDGIESDREGTKPVGGYTDLQLSP